MYGHLQHMLASRPCSVVLFPSSQQSKKHFTIQKQLKEDPLRKMLKQSHDFFVADVPRRDFDQNLGVWYSLTDWGRYTEFDLCTSFSTGLQHLDRLISIASIDGHSSDTRETVFPSVVTLAAVSQKYYALSAFSALISWVRAIMESIGLAQFELTGSHLAATLKAASVNIWSRTQCSSNMFLQRVRKIFRSNWNFFWRLF